MTNRRLLGIFAHPDDESRIVGGALAKYASEGVTISLVVATRGEVGSCGEPPLCTPEELPQLREAELREACAILGVHDLSILDYRDGTLSDVDRIALTGQLVAAIRRVRPQVVLTFGPEGRTLHPDHTAIYEAATVAFNLAAYPHAYPEHDLAPFAATKLYYTAIPESQAQATNWRFPSIPDADVTVALDVSAWIDQKKRATNDAHRSQAHDQPFGGLPETDRWHELSAEYYRLAATHDIDRPACEDSFFAGIQE